jgi:hypothetical protein
MTIQYPLNDGGRPTPCVYILKVLHPIWSCGSIDVLNHPHSSHCPNGRRRRSTTPDAPHGHALHNGSPFRRTKELQTR